jgi:hypothetical protein
MMVWTGDSCGQCGSKNYKEIERESSYPPWQKIGKKAKYYECECGAVWALDAGEEGWHLRDIEDSEPASTA